MASVGINVAKVLVIVSNLIFFLCACGLMVLGALFFTSRYHGAYQDTLGDKFAGYTIFAAILIGVGLFILILTFTGCCGAWQENTCLLTTYATILALLLLTQIAIAIAAFVERGSTLESIDSSAYESISATGAYRDIYRAWNDTQIYLGCCGVRGAGDWSTTEGSPFYGTNFPKYPDHCCQEFYPGCAEAGKIPFRVGCLTKVLVQFENYGLAIGLSAIIIGFIEVLGVVLACCLIRAVPGQGAVPTTEEKY